MIFYNHKRLNHSLMQAIKHTIYLLSLVVFLFAFVLLYEAIIKYQTASRLLEYNQMTDSFVFAMMDFVFERGRMNVVLSNPAPMSAENDIFLKERERLANEQLSDAFIIMDKLYPEGAGYLRTKYDRINSLRQTARVEAGKPKYDRDPEVRKAWLQECSAFNSDIYNTLSSYNEKLASTDRYSQMQRLKLSLLEFRNYAGLESTYIVSSMNNETGIDSNMLRLIYETKGKKDAVWHGIVASIRYIGKDTFVQKMNLIENEYYTLYLPELYEQFDLMLNHKKPALKQEEVAAKSVKALDSVKLLLEEASAAANQETLYLSKQANIGLMICFLMAILAAIFMIYIPYAFNKNILIPVGNVIASIKKILPFTGEDGVPGSCAANEIKILEIAVEQLIKSMLQETELKSEVEKLAETDQLTGLLNMRGFYKKIQSEAACSKGKIYGAMVIADIDHFKRINDSYGHLIGDIVLKDFSDCLKSQCRPEDSVARYGGEEFIICLPRASTETAVMIAERMRKRVAEYKYIDNGIAICLTASFGIAIFDGEGEFSLNNMMQKADIALYRAKATGRDRVCIWDQESDGAC